MSDNFKVVEHEVKTVNDDKTGIHKKEVRSSLGASVKDDFINNNHDHTGQSNNRKSSDKSIPGDVPPYRPDRQSDNQLVYNAINLSGDREASTLTSKENEQSGNIKTPQYSKQSKPVKEEFNDLFVGESSKKAYRSVENDAGGNNLSIEKIINRDKSDIGKEFIKPHAQENAIDLILTDTKEKIESKILGNKNEPAAQKGKIIGKAQLYDEKIHSIPQKRGAIKTAIGIASREAENAVGRGGNGSLSGNITRQGYKHGLRTLKNTGVATGIAVRGTYRYGKYSVKAVSDVKNGILTGKEASLSILKRGGVSLKGSGVSVIKFAGNEVKRNMIDFKGSDDLGIQAITKPKDVIITTNRTIKAAKATVNTSKRIISGIKKTAVRAFHAPQKVVAYAKQAAYIAKAIGKKLITNAVAAKGLAVAGGGLLSIIIALIPIIVVAITIPTLSLKSEDWELTKTYSYITKLDTNETFKIQEADEITEYREIYEFHYFLNGIENGGAMEIYTNADYLLMYFDCKYEDYILDKIMLFFGGTSVRAEIEKIHGLLHQVSFNERQQIIPHGFEVCPGGEELSPEEYCPGGEELEPAVYDEYGYEIDPCIYCLGGEIVVEAEYCPGGMVHDCEGGEYLLPPVVIGGIERYSEPPTCPGGNPEEIYAIKNILDVRLDTKRFEDYLEENRSTLMSEDEYEMFLALMEVGAYTFRQELGSPFVGVDWSIGVSSRFGWRIHPITGEKDNHEALDIAMPGGTPINAVMSGTATIHSDPDGYGNYVIVENAEGTTTLYAHMSGFAVSDNQLIVQGDVIGYVGTTGSSTGNHLHLEYEKDGHRLNPRFFVYCESEAD